MAKAKSKKRTRRKALRHSVVRGRQTEVALAGLAHDIRTPLNGILALSELLQASDLPPRERGWAEAIRESADHLARLTSIVVDAAKARSAELVLREQPFSPRGVANAVAGSLAGRVEGKALAARVEIADDMPERVLGDEMRLRSALENLIDNAVKFTERGSISFAVACARAGRGRSKLTFTVTDTGMGMTQTEMRRLFVPFAQASREVSRRFGGAGLGLVLVKSIAKSMGGSLVVTSKPGRGSTFKLTAVLKPAPKQEAAPGPISGLRVLCVEDNPYGRMVHNVVLRELGHQASFISDGEAAVQTVAAGEHDAVLMDVALPGIDGIEATRRIRALPNGASRIPIIGVSGRDGADDAAAAEAAGMDIYLRKPAAPAELSAALQQVLALRRAESAGR